MIDEKAKKQEGGKTHDELTTMYADYVTSTHESRRKAERDRDYYDSKQWTSEEQAALKKRGQPIITINRIKPKIDALIGIEIQTRVDIKAFPRTPRDELASEAVTEALRYCADNTDFDQIKTEAAFNLFVEGTMAAIVEIKQSPSGPEVNPVNIPWDRLIIDPRSSRKDGKDARWMGMAIWLDTEVAKEMYPKADAGAFAIDNYNQGDTHDDKPDDLYINDNRSKLIEMYYLSKGQWYHCVFTGLGFAVEPRLSPYLDEDGSPTCPIEVQSAFIDRDNNRYGIVRPLISVQDEINKRRSKAMHLLSTRQVRADAGAVENVNTAKRELNKPDGWLETNPGKAIEIMSTTELASGQFSLLQEAKSEIDSVGANAAVLGKDDRVQSGRALQSRQQAGMAELMPVLDGLRSWENRMYRQFWARMKQFYTEEKAIRITDDPEKVKFLVLNQQITMGMKLQEQGIPFDVNDPRAQQVVEVQSNIPELDMDIVLSAVPDTISIEAEQFEILSQMYMANPESIPMEMIIESSSLRNKKQIIESMQGGDEEARAAKQQKMDEALALEKADKEAEIFGKKAKGMRDMSEARATDLETDMTESGVSDLVERINGA